MQDQCPRKVTHSNNTRTAMSPGGSHRQLFRSVRTHQYSFHVRTAPFTRTRIFFEPHFFLHDSAFLQHEISKSANRKRHLFKTPPHCIFVSDSTDLQIRVADGNQVLSNSIELPGFSMVSAILYLCGQCLKLERLKSRRFSS